MWSGPHSWWVTEMGTEFLLHSEVTEMHRPTELQRRAGILLAPGKPQSLSELGFPLL